MTEDDNMKIDLGEVSCKDEMWIMELTQNHV
jgi:hypothetical protein